MKELAGVTLIESGTPEAVFHVENAFAFLLEQQQASVEYFLTSFEDDDGFEHAPPPPSEEPKPFIFPVELIRSLVWEDTPPAA